MVVSLISRETVCSCCGWTIPASAPAVINDTDYTEPRVFCRRCYQEARPLHEESVCSCCGRTIPAIAPVVVNDTDYTEPRVFCRRCCDAGPMRDRQSWRSPISGQARITLKGFSRSA